MTYWPSESDFWIVVGTFAAIGVIIYCVVNRHNNGKNKG